MVVVVVVEDMKESLNESLIDLLLQVDILMVGQSIIHLRPNFINSKKKLNYLDYVERILLNLNRFNLVHVIQPLFTVY